MPVVVDASVVVSWLLDDEESDAVLRTRCRDEQVHVPAHWQAEVANALLSAERRTRSGPILTSALADVLAFLEPVVDFEGAEEAFVRILPLARAHQLTVYDAVYLELAGRLGIELATLDIALARAARSTGIPISGETA